MHTSAIILDGPRDLSLGTLGVTEPKATDLVVEIEWSGISTGTEKLFWTGEMPPFPGMGYPPRARLRNPPAKSSRPGPTPRSAPATVSSFRAPPASRARAVSSAGPPARVVTDRRPGRPNRFVARPRRARFSPLSPPPLATRWPASTSMCPTSSSATACSAGSWRVSPSPPARRRPWSGTPTPSAARVPSATRCSTPPTTPATNYASVYDASGAQGILNTAITRIARGGEVVLAGFYPEPINFAFPPAFMKEARIRVAGRMDPRRPHRHALAHRGRRALAFGSRHPCRRSGRRPRRLRNGVRRPRLPQDEFSTGRAHA